MDRRILIMGAGLVLGSSIASVLAAEIVRQAEQIAEQQRVAWICYGIYAYRLFIAWQCCVFLPVALPAISIFSSPSGHWHRVSGPVS